MHRGEGSNRSKSHKRKRSNKPEKRETNEGQRNRKQTTSCTRPICGQMHKADKETEKNTTENKHTKTMDSTSSERTQNTSPQCIRCSTQRVAVSCMLSSGPWCLSQENCALVVVKKQSGGPGRAEERTEGEKAVPAVEGNRYHSPGIQWGTLDLRRESPDSHIPRKI